MRMRGGVVLPVLVLQLLLGGGCGGDDGGDDDTPGLDGGADGAAGDGDGGGADAMPCVKQWTVMRTGNATHSAAVTANGLELKSRNSVAGSLLLVQADSALTGDFTAGFDWEAWSSAGPGAFVQAVVAQQGAGGEFAVAGVGRIPLMGNPPGLGAARQPGGMPSDFAQSDTTAGRFQFVRTGSSLTVTASAAVGGAAATISTDLGSGPLLIGLQIGSSSGAPILGESSMHVTGFDVTGGGGAVASDNFRCDSLQN